MTRCSPRASVAFAIALFAVLVVDAPAVGAQPLGTFHWRLEPYCNIVTVQVSARGPVFALDGLEASCGVNPPGGVTGVAFVNPDGSIGIGLTTVASADGRAAHLDARVTLPTLHGTWRDSMGNTGPFVPVARNAPSTNSPRAILSNGIPLRSITAGQIAPAAIGRNHLAAGLFGDTAIDTHIVQRRIGGTCPVGHYARGVNFDGTLTCTQLAIGPVGTVSTTIDDPDGHATGEWSSLAIGGDGLPVVAHRDGTAGALRVTHCGDVACSTNNVSTTIDAAAGRNSGYMARMAIGADGLPVIAHIDIGLSQARFTHCGDVACGSGNTTVVIAGSNRAEYPAVAIGRDGLPVVAYQDNTNEGVALLHCGNVGCTAGNTITFVDSARDNNMGDYTSIAIGADGLPIVSYTTGVLGTLRVIHCGSADCATDALVTEVYSPNVGSVRYTSIAIGSDNRPIVAIADTHLETLVVVHCGNAACSAGNTVTTVDDPPSAGVGRYASLAIGGDGLPVIGHYGETDGGLRITHCGTVDCSSGNVSTTVDAVDRSMGRDVSLAIGRDGLPVVSHSNNRAHRLRVTHCGTRTCQ